MSYSAGASPASSLRRSLDQSHYLHSFSPPASPHRHLSSSSLSLDLDAIVDDENFDLDSLAVSPHNELVKQEEVEELEAIARKLSVTNTNADADCVMYADSHSVLTNEDGEKFDWASCAAAAIRASVSSNGNSGSQSTATTAVSSPASSTSSLSLSQSVMGEDKTDPSSPSLSPLLTSVPSVMPFIPTSQSSTLTLINKDTPLTRVSSSMPLSTRVRTYAAIIIQHVDNGSFYTEELFECCQSLRKLLSISLTAPFTETIDSGLLAYFRTLLQYRLASSQLQLEIAWILTNIASSSTAHVQSIIDAALAPVLLAHIRIDNEFCLLEQIIWCCGNIAGDCCETRNELLNAGLTEKLSSLLMAMTEQQLLSSLSLVKQCSWTLYNLARYKPSPPIIRLAPTVPVIKKLFSVMNFNYCQCSGLELSILIDLLWLMSCLTDAGDSLKQSLTASNIGEFDILDICVNLIKCYNQQSLSISLQSQSITNELLIPALRTTGNFFTSTPDFTQLALDKDYLPLISALVNNHCINDEITKEVCWSLSNIAAGNNKQINKLCEQENLLSNIFALHGAAERAVSVSVRKEILWIIANLCECGNETQLQYLVSLNGIAIIADTLVNTDISSSYLSIASTAAMYLFQRVPALCNDSEAQLLSSRLVDSVQRLLTSHHVDTASLDSAAMADILMGMHTASERQWSDWADALQSSDEDHDRLVTWRHCYRLLHQHDMSSDNPQHTTEERRPQRDHWTIHHDSDTDEEF